MRFRRPQIAGQQENRERSQTSAKHDAAAPQE
jgi:hypothetical protein